MAPKVKNRQQKAAHTTQVPSRETRNEETSKSADSLHALPLELQQVILNVFTTAFTEATRDYNDLKSTVQEVKGHLYNRDFVAAFSKPSYLQAYALRWSSARALAYANIFTHQDRFSWYARRSHDADNIRSGRNIHQNTAAGAENFEGSVKSPSDAAAMTAVSDPAIKVNTSLPSSSRSNNNTITKIVCIGGGAGAEIVGLTAAHRFFSQSDTNLKIIAVDIADWADTVSRLTSALSTPPPSSTHASEAARSRIENRALIEENVDDQDVSITTRQKIDVKFLQQDVLEWSDDETNSSEHLTFRTAMSDASLCTIMFTLNELFSTSLPKTTSLLLNLTDTLPKGSHLLVVDSPGSYSQIKLGGRSSSQNIEQQQVKKYPMKWLLDHTLLEVASKDENTKWIKKEDEDSVWFRIEQQEKIGKGKLRYPLELENMRYQIHLYERR